MVRRCEWGKASVCNQADACSRIFSVATSRSTAAIRYGVAA